MKYVFLLFTWSLMITTGTPIPAFAQQAPKPASQATNQPARGKNLTQQASKTPEKGTKSAKEGPKPAQYDANEILWDSFGVPHIYARSQQQMYYEFGWAQMHNHANLLLRLYGQARGRAAEYWGERFLASDKLMRLFQINELADKEYQQQPPAFKEFIDAFVKGVNDYASGHPDSMAAENKVVLPVRASDIFAHLIRVVYLRFVAGDDLGMASRKVQAGSNAVAISPSRSATGHAMLLANPHLPWADLFTFFEAHLQAPDFNAYGVSLVGLPVLNIAFNEHLGWTHTVNTIDACDQYELSVKNDGYSLDGKVLPFTKDTASVKVRQSDGTLKTETFTNSYSRHGPILGIKGDKAFAIRIAGLRNAHMLYQWHCMAAAKDWGQFEKALKMLQIPMFNVIYADNAGNISYLFGGNVPRRAEGDWQFWKGAVDGTSGRLIWTQTLGYEELPKLFNPHTGFIQNANDPPWTCTYPAQLDPRNYPAYISPILMPLRPQRAVNLIRHDSLITPDRLSEYKLNTGIEAADRFLDSLLAAVTQFPDSIAQQAAAVLRKWDRKTNAGSRGAVLFARWFDKLGDASFREPWTPDRPVETPEGLRDPKAAVALLAHAARETMQEYDSLNVAWGDVFRFRAAGQDYPANGGPGDYGIYRAIYFVKDADRKFRAIAGDSYVAVTEFGPETKGRVLLSYGNSSQPHSRHAWDQLLLLSQQQWRQAWLKRNDIMDHLEEKERF